MFAEKIGESVSTTGTGTFSLTQTAFGAFRTWRSGFSTGVQAFYLATSDDGTTWEVGYGTFTTGSPDTLTRNVLASSSGGTAINWAVTPYRVYNVPSAIGMAFMLAPLVNGVANVPAWLPAGALWIDYSAGISTLWVVYRYVSGTRTTAASHVEVERYSLGLSGATANVTVASQRRVWTDVGAASKTVAAGDVGGIFSMDNSAAVRTLTLPAASTTGVGHGFMVGGLGRSTAFPIVITPNGADSIEGGTAGASRTLPGGVMFDVQYDGASSTWRIIINSNMTAGGFGGSYSGRRQTVIGGPDDSNGLPNFLATVSGLALSTSNVSSSAPLVVTAAGGFGYTGQVDRFGVATANVSFGTLANATTSYLYVDIDAAGNLTGGNTTTAPVYQQGGTYSTTSGQFTFNITEKVGKLGNGSVANQVWRVFVGEADTSGGNVAAVRAYAFNGIYWGPYTATLFASGTPQTFSHNIGVEPLVSDLRLKCTTTDSGYAVGDIVSCRSVYFSSNYPMAITLGVRQANVIYNGASVALPNKSSGALSNLTLANWSYCFFADRGW